MGQSVSNLIARNMLGILDSQGVVVSTIMAQSGISRHVLEKSGGRLSPQQHFRFLQFTGNYQEIIIKSMLERNIQQGLTAFNYSNFPEFVGSYLNQETGMKLLQVYQQYRKIVGDCDEILITRNDTYTRIEYVIEGPRAGNFSAVGNFIMMFDALRNSIPDLRGHIWLEIARDGSDSVLEAFFGQRCHFSQTHNLLLLENSQLDRPNHCFNRLLHQGQMLSLQRSCEQITSPLTFAGLVSELIEHAFEQAWLQGEQHILPQVCALLGISRWTLNERLRPDRTSFTELLKQTRLRLACRLLVETDQSILQISERVCFSSQAVFSRFFSTHLNIPPLSYRQRYRQVT
jgi:AraC-like DNA-binding protein